MVPGGNWVELVGGYDVTLVTDYSELRVLFDANQTIDPMEKKAYATVIYGKLTKQPATTYSFTQDFCWPYSPKKGFIAEGDVPWSQFVTKDGLPVNVVNFDDSVSQYQPTLMYNWFYGAKEIQEINGLDKIDLSNLMELNHTFYECTNLKKVVFNNNIINERPYVRFSYAFAGCLNLEVLDLGGLPVNCDNNSITPDSPRIKQFGCWFAHGGFNRNLRGLLFEKHYQGT